MSLTITDEPISGRHTPHTVRLGHFQAGDAWQVSWLPGQLMDRNAAITAMLIAEIAVSGPAGAKPGRTHVAAFGPELGLTPGDALRWSSARPEPLCTSVKDDHPGSLMTDGPCDWPVGGGRWEADQ